MFALRWSVIALCLASAGCFTVSPVDGTVKCTPGASHTCPSGYVCDSVTSTCYKGHAPTGAHACASGSDCANGQCVDGYCCNSLCDGVCEACNVPGSLGTCTPVPAKTDPANECTAKMVGDTGADAGINQPPGGVFTSLAACAGACDGQGACKYPDATTSCGQTFCNDSATVATFTCDGSGDCEPKLAKCVDYACAISACKTTCAADSDCLTTDYCDVSTGTCKPQLGDGQSCAGNDQCQHGHCVSNTAGTGSLCCNSACSTADNMQCDTSGLVGTCTCGALASCANGCELFYIDNDVDGHGDENGTLANGGAMAGCTGTKSLTSNGKSFYPDDEANKGHLDCDDADPNTFYGQTTFYDIPRAHPTATHPAYDYDCDGAEAKNPAQPEFSHGCQACTYYTGTLCNGAGFCCIDNNGQCSTNTAINPVNNPSGFNCGFNCPNGSGGYQCCGTTSSAFPGTVACGQAGGAAGYPWTVCGVCTGGAPPQQTTDGTLKMSCH